MNQSGTSVSQPSPCGQSDRASQIARALAYPYGRPYKPFVFQRGQCQPWADTGQEFAGQRTLTPVLAIGSNASTEQLRRKFGSSNAVRIPVTIGELHNHDVVYSAYMTGYGSIPATLIASPGTSVQVAITWLNQDLLATMHGTESLGAHTVYGCVTDLEMDESLSLGSSTPLDYAFTYHCCLGELSLAGVPVPLLELEATGRRYRPLAQQVLQRRLRRWLEPQRLRKQLAVDADFACWVARNTEDGERRALATDCLQQNRLDLTLPGFTVL